MNYEYPNDVRKKIDELIAMYEGIREIWLFGSRANGTNKEDSDWDILIIADQHVLNLLEKEGSERYLTLDIMVVFDQDNFRGPWRRESDKAYKHGSLQKWEWKELQSGVAKYKATKDVYGQILPEEKICQAIRIFHRGVYMLELAAALREIMRPRNSA